MKYIITVIVFSLSALLADAEARPFARDCPSGASESLREAVNYLDTHMDAVRSIYEAGNNYHPRRGANRRVKRRLGRDRKLGNLWFACANDRSPLCKNADARHAIGAASNKIRICYNNVLESSSYTSGFCNLVGLVAHEFGHAVGMKKDRVGRHSKNRNDRVYRWGWAWENFCSSNGHDKSL